MTIVRLFVLPIFKKHYLFHASVTHTVSATPSQIISKKSATLRIQERIQYYIEDLQRKFQIRVSRTWTEFEKANERSLKGRIYRLAQNVLAREDPQETSLKAIPKASEIRKLQIIYPVLYLNSLKEALIRRRLRMMLKTRRSVHRSCLIGWCIGTLPLLPLLVTPIPNLPLYYAIYRIYSNYFVASNCESLQILLRQYNTKRLYHFQMNPDLELNTKGWKIELKGCQKMEELLLPSERRRHPLPDEAVIELNRAYNLPGLLDVVARARRKTTGAMFPQEFSQKHSNNTNTNNNKSTQT